MILVLVLKCGYERLNVMSGANHYTVEHLFELKARDQVFAGYIPFAGPLVIPVWLQFSDLVPKSDELFITELFSI